MVTKIGRRLREPSTWAALASMLIGAGFEVAQMLPAVAVGLKVAGGVAGFVGIVLREGGKGA